jgi:RHS repeat-associated protein
MAQYNATAFNASLNIEDTPIRYVSPMGPTIDFIATYNQKENQQPAAPNYSNLGPKWTFNWLSYITVADTSDVGVPTSVARVYLPGGGTEVYDSFTTSSGQDRQSHAVIWRSGADRYERRLPDGSKQIFGPTSTTANFGRRRLYLAETRDPTNNGVFITYDTASPTTPKIVSVKDSLQQGLTFAYTNSDPLKITSVQDSFNHTATINYYGDGKLQSITDPVNIQSTVFYETGGDFINKLTTPYGDSLFSHGAAGTSVLTMTDPEGGQEKVEFKNQSSAIASAETTIPNASGISNSALNMMNTFYWDKKAMTVAPNDYTKAKVTHWLYNSDGTISSILSSEKKTLERRVWYTYDGQTNGNEFVGTTVSAAQIARVLDDGGTQMTQIWKYSYTTLGKLKTVSDPHFDSQHNSAPRVTSYKYDDATGGYDLTEVWQQNPAAPTFDPYDSTKHADKIANYANYALHKPQLVTDAAGKTTTYTYNSYGQMLTQQNAQNELTTYTYDRNQNGDADTDGYLILVTSAPVNGVSPTMTFTYDGGADRVQTVTTGPDNYAVTTTRDGLGRPTVITYSDTPQTTQQFDYHKYVDGVLQSAVMTLDVGKSTDRRGRSTYREYNGVRRLTKVKEHVSDSPAVDRLTQYTWCNCGALTSIKDGNNNVTSFSYDDQGRVTQKQFADLTAINYLYEGQATANTAAESGRLKSMTDARGITTTYTYFADDTLKQISYSDGITPSATFAYDANYNRITSMSDGTGVTNYSYYSVQTSPPAGAFANALKDVDGPLLNDTITFTYDSLGRKTGQSVNGVASTVNYNAAGQVDSSINPLGQFSRTYVPGTSRIQTMTYPNGVSATYSYFGNSADRRLQTIQNFGLGSTNLSRFDYTYDADGQILTWNKLLGTIERDDTFSYDLVDQLTGSSEYRPPDVYANQTFTYDLAGNRTDGGSNTFNAANQVTNAGYSYLNPPFTGTDNNGNLTADPARTYEWDAANRLTAINYINIPGTRTEFTYDGLGRRVKISEKTLPPPDINVNITPSGRQYALTTFTSVTLSAGTYKLTITGLNPNGGSNMALVDAIKLNGTLINNGSFETPVLASGVAQFNPTGAAPWSFTGTTGIVRNNNTTYTGTVPAPDGHQAGMVQNTGSVSQILPNLAAGSYVLKLQSSQAKGNTSSQQFKTTLQNTAYSITTSTKQFVWSGNEIAEQRDASNTVTRRFFADGEQIAGTNYYYTRDHLGSVRELVDSLGAVHAQYDYDAYGYSTKLSGDLDASFGYTGHFFHQASGLNLTLYRVYDSGTGRWISRDPIAETGGLNLYAYVSNDPIAYIDTLGLDQNLAGAGVATRGLSRHNSFLTFEASCPSGTKVANVRVNYPQLAAHLQDTIASMIFGNQDPSSPNPRSVDNVNCKGMPVIVRAYMRTRYASYLFGSAANVGAYQRYTFITYDCVRCCQ